MVRVKTIPCLHGFSFLVYDTFVGFKDSKVASQQTQNICITFVQCRPNVWHFTNAIQMFCVCWDDIDDKSESAPAWNDKTNLFVKNRYPQIELFDQHDY